MSDLEIKRKKSLWRLGALHDDQIVATDASNSSATSFVILHLGWHTKLGPRGQQRSHTHNQNQHHESSHAHQGSLIKSSRSYDVMGDDIIVRIIKTQPSTPE